MKRFFVSVLLVLLLLLGASGIVYAAESTTDDIYEQSMDEMSDSLPDSARQYLYGEDMRAEGGVFNAFLRLVNSILGDWKSIAADPLRLFGMLCTVMVLCAAAGYYSGENGKLGGGGDPALSVVGSLAISAAVSGIVAGAVSAALETVHAAETFVTGFVPVYTGILISSGQLSTAAIYGAGIVAATTVASSVVTLIIRPLAGVLLGLAIVSGIQDSGLTALSEGIQKTVNWGLGIVVSLFVGLMGLQSSVSAHSDNLAIRTTRYLVGNSIPVIGSSVSEAVGTVTASFKVIRGTVGSGGILALCAIFLPPLLRLLLCSVSLSVSALVGEVMGVGNLSRSIRAVRSAIGIVIAVLAFYFMALAMCTAIMINSGG